MILSTTPTLEGKPVKAYLGLVAGETIVGANVVRDFFASITDVIGGRGPGAGYLPGRAWCRTNAGCKETRWLRDKSCAGATGPRAPRREVGRGAVR